MARGLTQRTLSGMLWMGYGKAAFAILQLIVLAVLARLVSPLDFGVVSAALVVIGFSSIVSQLGLGPAIVQRRTLEPRHLTTAFVTSILLGLALGTIVWTGAPLAAQFMHLDGLTPVLRALAWVFPLNGLGTVSSGLLSRELRFSWLANLDVLSYGIGYGAVGITTALFGWGVWALVAGQLGQALIRNGILLAKHPPPLPLSMERSALHDLLYFGGGFTIAKLANYAAVTGDSVVSGRFLGATALGYYGRAYSLMSAPAYAFGAVLDVVLFPAMAKVQDDPPRLAAAYRRGVALIAIVVLAPSATIILLAPEVVHVLLGARWSAVVMPFQILGIGMLFRTSYKMSDSIARSTGAVYRRAWRQILYAGLVVLGAWIGQHWGVTGVAWGALAALTVNFLLMAELSLDVARITWGEFWTAHRPAVLLTVCSFPVVWGAALLTRQIDLPAMVVILVV
ncbi:MAG TPA: lipopolysaccharide biosynthesis protein, partial [Gemmatimonadales bacterium]|nr:lipopolysaccharide biosynthesis protein [Gemmatimonadales bacterium]